MPTPAAAKVPEDMKNWQYCAATIELKEDIEKSFLALGERLMLIRNGSLYHPSYENFREFLREMGMAEGTGSRLIGIYEKYVLLGGMKPEELVSPRGWDNLSKFLPYIKTPEQAREYAGKALVLSREDALKEAFELRTGNPMSACAHPDTYLMRICRACGDKRHVDEEEKN